VFFFFSLVFPRNGVSVGEKLRFRSTSSFRCLERGPFKDSLEYYMPVSGFFFFRCPPCKQYGLAAMVGPSFFLFLKEDPAPLGLAEALRFSPLQTFANVFSRSLQREVFHPAFSCLLRGPGRSLPKTVTSVAVPPESSLCGVSYMVFAFPFFISPTSDQAHRPQRRCGW